MKIKIHIVYISIISILSILLIQNYWSEYQIEKGIEIIDDLMTPKASSLTEDELYKIFTDSESELKKMLALFEQTTNLCWIVKTDESVKISLFSNTLIDKPSQINNDELINLDFLDFYTNIGLDIINDSLLISSNDSILIATSEWKVEFNYADWIGDFSKFLNKDELVIEQLGKLITQADLYRIEAIFLEEGKRIFLFYFDDNQSNHFIYMKNHSFLPKEFQSEKELVIGRESYQVKLIQDNVFLTPSGQNVSIIELNE